MALEVVEITDPQSGSMARIAPGFGFNCFSWQPSLSSGPVEALWSHANFLQGTERPSGSGIPLLFPFAGRMPGTTFAFGGKKYHLQPGDAQGNAIHGFVMSRPWRVVNQEAKSVTGEFQASVDDPSLEQSWPADFCLRVTYTIEGRAIFSDLSVENPGETPLPFALATHAYFRLPIGGTGSVGETVVMVPVHEVWELENLIPTGHKTDIGDLAGLAEGLTLGDRVLDKVLTRLDYQSGRTATTLRNPHSGCQLIQTFDDSFRHVVVYTPPHREAICLEPYTAIPNALALAEQGIETGLRWLAPGEKYQTRIVIELSE